MASEKENTKDVVEAEDESDGSVEAQVAHYEWQQASGGMKMFVGYFTLISELR